MDNCNCCIFFLFLFVISVFRHPVSYSTFWHTVNYFSRIKTNVYRISSAKLDKNECSFCFTYKHIYRTTTDSISHFKFHIDLLWMHISLPFVTACFPLILIRFCWCLNNIVEHESFLSLISIFNHHHNKNWSDSFTI